MRLVFNHLVFFYASLLLTHIFIITQKKTCLHECTKREKNCNLQKKLDTFCCFFFKIQTKKYYFASVKVA